MQIIAGHSICLNDSEEGFGLQFGGVIFYIGYYNPSVWIIELVSHTTYVVCVNCIYRWRDLHFKVGSEQQIFEKLFMAILFNLRAFARNLLREYRRRNTFCILFWYLAWDSNSGFLSNKPTHYLLDHGDQKLVICGSRKTKYLCVHCQEIAGGGEQ